MKEYKIATIAGDGIGKEVVIKTHNKLKLWHLKYIQEK